MEGQRGAALHVRGADAPDALGVHCGRKILCDGYRVEVPGQHHALRSPEVGAGDDGVAQPFHLQVRLL
jgi:hypothetical protein